MITTSITSRPTHETGCTRRSVRIRALRESIARRALATTSTPADARILRVVRTGNVLTIATEQPGQRFPFNVDSYRLPTPDYADFDKDDPNFDEANVPKRWTLLDEYGGHTAAQVEQMMAKALTYAVCIREGR